MEFKTKQIQAGGKQRRIVLQNDNGPCPLLAVANCLILMDGLQVDEPKVTSDWLLDVLSHRAGPQLDSFRQQLLHGLDANPVFDGTFKGGANEMFALFGLPLVHGWVMPRDEPFNCTQSYDELTAQLTTATHEGAVLAGEQFMAKYPSQISPQGVELLLKSMDEGDVVVLFRNNHYSTLLKRGKLFTLVTDVGFASYGDIVWEDLDGSFYEANLALRQDCSRDEEIARGLQEQERSEQSEQVKGTRNRGQQGNGTRNQGQQKSSHGRSSQKSCALS